MKRKTHRVLFRCDGSSTIGLGHVMRCLALAEELESLHGMESSFALRTDESGAQLIQRYNYPVYTPKIRKRFDYSNWLRELAKECHAEVLVLDVRDNLPVSALEDLRQTDVLLVTLDDPSQRRLHVDLAFYPPVPQVDRLDWTRFTGRLFKGWDWIPLRKEVSETPIRDHSDQVRSLLVTTGGADPAGMAPRIVEFLDGHGYNFKTVIVAGPAFQHRRELERAVDAASGMFRIEDDPVNLPALMAETDLAIASFGVTAFELAAMGVPALLLCLTEDHEESASIFAEAGIFTSLGLFSRIDGAKFSRELQALLESSELREERSLKGRKTADGKGSKRISNLIFECLQKRVNNGK